MNTKGNQRFQDTRRAIEEAFIQLLDQQSEDQITVAQICRRAGIHRTTFYHHYQDVPQLMEEMIHNQYADFIYHFGIRLGEGADLEGGITSMLETVKANPSFFRRMLAHQRGPQTGPGLALEPEFSRMLGSQSAQALEYQRGAFRAAMGYMVHRWLDQGCDLPPRELARLILTLFPWKEASGLSS